MSALDWDRVHPGDEIACKGRVSEVHEREDGAVCFVVTNAVLTDHTPRKRKDQGASFTTWVFKIYREASA